MANKTQSLIRSLTVSQDKPIKAIIKGDFPQWLNGSLFRNGPGRFKFGNKSYKHLFDGMACINKFEINNGNVYFSNKILETHVLKETLSSNRLYPMFGTPDLCSTLFDRFKMFFTSENDNVNVNVVPFADNQLYALTEANILVRVDPQSLGVVNRANITKYLDKTSTSIAHPHVDSKDGSWISVGMQPRGKYPSYDFIKFDGKKCSNVCETVKLLARVPSSHKYGLSYFHSFGITENYIVFLEQSLIISMKEIFKNFIKNKPFLKALKMDESFNTKIHLINKHTGQLLPHKFHTVPQFTFHHINAYETGGRENEIHVDISSYHPNELHLDNADYETTFNDDILDKSKPIPRRIRILLDKGKSDESTFCEIKDLNTENYFDLGTINYWKYNGKPYKYAYGLDLSKNPHKIVKLNTTAFNDAKTVVIQDRNQKLLPSEPVFVEKPNAVDEDDGVVLSLVLGEEYDFLQVIDAKSMQEIARAQLPETSKASFTFHGFFADNSKKIEL